MNRQATLKYYRDRILRIADEPGNRKSYLPGCIKFPDPKCRDRRDVFSYPVYLATLEAAYRITGKSEYRRRATALLASLPKLDQQGDGDFSTNGGSCFAWPQVMSLLPPLLAQLTPRERRDVERFFDTNGGVIMQTDDLTAGNRTALRAAYVEGIAKIFPDDPQALWRRRNAEMQRRVADLSDEASPGYTALAFCTNLNAALRRGDDLRRRADLKTFGQHLVDLTSPLGFTADYGDQNTFDYTHSILPGLLQYLGNIFKLPEFTWASHQIIEFHRRRLQGPWGPAVGWDVSEFYGLYEHCRKHWTPPRPPERAPTADYGKCFVLRTGWEAADSFLSVYGQTYAGHGHRCPNALAHYFAHGAQLLKNAGYAFFQPYDPDRRCGEIERHDGLFMLPGIFASGGEIRRQSAQLIAPDPKSIPLVENYVGLGARARITLTVTDRGENRYHHRRDIQFLGRNGVLIQDTVLPVARLKHTLAVNYHLGRLVCETTEYPGRIGYHERPWHNHNARLAVMFLEGFEAVKVWQWPREGELAHCVAGIDHLDCPAGAAKTYVSLLLPFAGPTVPDSLAPAIDWKNGVIRLANTAYRVEFMAGKSLPYRLP